MSNEVDFRTLCKTKLQEYLTSEGVTDEYDIYTVWDSYWTIGIPVDSVPDTENAKAILATTLNNGFFEFTKAGETLTLKVFTLSNTESFNLNEQVSAR